jgi:hypothetical protein
VKSRKNDPITTSHQANKAETPSILDHFAEMPDPRRDNKNKRHKLISIIAIAILATICGAERFTEMEEWGKANIDWLRSFLELPNGIPSHDTFGDVFASLDTTEFKRCFISWVNAIRTMTDGEVIAIDGKTLRRSHNRPTGASAIHLVSASRQEQSVDARASQSRREIE